MPAGRRTPEPPKLPALFPKCMHCRLNWPEKGEDNMTLTTIMDSHECLEYRAGRYCAQVAQVSSKKTKHCDLRLVGQVLSPNG